MQVTPPAQHDWFIVAASVMDLSQKPLSRVIAPPAIVALVYYVKKGSLATSTSHLHSRRIMRLPVHHD